MKQIPLCDRNGNVRAYAKIDDEDYERIDKYTWHITKGHACRWIYPDQKAMYMHWDVLGGRPPAGLLTDHINQDKLDNRKANLRMVTPAQNSSNRVGYGRGPYKGVYARKYRFKTSYETSITKDGKGVHIGPFENPHIAAVMYDFWAVQLHGEHACTNFKVVKWG